jgi:hypothetical protein
LALGEYCPYGFAIAGFAFFAAGLAIKITSFLFGWLPKLQTNRQSLAGATLSAQCLFLLEYAYQCSFHAMGRNDGNLFGYPSFHRGAYR